MPGVGAPLVAALGGVTNEALAAIRRNSEAAGGGAGHAPVTAALHSELRELVRAASGALNAIGVGHPALDEVSAAFAPLGLATKLTGAGGGGCALTLLGQEDDTRAGVLATVIESLKARGFDVFETSLGGEGVMLLDEGPRVQTGWQVG